MRKWILAKFIDTEMLILNAQIVNRIRKSWFSSYGQVGCSGEKAGTPEKGGAGGSKRSPCLLVGGAGGARVPSIGER